MNNFSTFITEIAKFLKSKGFRNNGNTFYIKNDQGNIGIINFQRSTTSTRTSTIFTINLGVNSAVLRTFFEEDDSVATAVINRHWTERIGLLLNGQDCWWTLKSDVPVKPLLEEIMIVLTSKAIPEIERNLSDESLRQNWMNRFLLEKADLKSSLNLTVLLKDRGETDVLNDVVKKLIESSKGKMYESTVRVHLKSILSPLSKP